MRPITRLIRLERVRLAGELSAIPVCYYSVNYETGEKTYYNEPDEGDLILEKWARQLVERGRRMAP